MSNPLSAPSQALPPSERLRRLGCKIKPMKLLWSVVRAVIVCGICFIILYPLIKKISVAIMDEQDLFDATVVYVAKHFTLDNFKVAWKAMNYPRAFGNTLLLSLVSSLLQLISCTLVAYGFARFQFPLNRLWFALVIFTIIVPPQTIMLPLFIEFRYFDIFGIIEAITGQPLNMINSLSPFVLLSATAMGFKNGLYIYMLRQYFKGFPKELEEAAYVDGAGRLRTFLRIMVPSAVPMMVTVFLFGFVWQWTDSFYSGLFLNDFQVMAGALNALPYNVASLYGDVSGSMSFVSPGYLSMVSNTGVLLCILPLFIIYLFLQKYFVESIARSGIVG